MRYQNEDADWRGRKEMRRPSKNGKKKKKIEYEKEAKEKPNV